MTTHAAHRPRAPRAPAYPGMRSVGFVAVLFMGVLQFQLLRTIQIDAFYESITRVDLMGFAMGQMLGAFLAIRAIARGWIQIVPIVLLIVLITYIALVSAITKPEYPILALLLSRNGILNWFLLGLGAAGMIDVFATARQRGMTRSIRRMVVITLALFGVMLANFALSYAATPNVFANYQPMSYSVIIVTIFTFVTIKSLWGEHKPMLLLSALFGVGTLLVAATALANSTLIVAFWAAFLLILFWNAMFRLWVPRNALLLTSVVLIAVGVSQSAIVSDIMEFTRFREFNESGGGRFSSVQNRLNILPNFEAQFAVSPIFGHFQAEVLSGAGEGYYLHSLPLSFLTHTGLVGFSLMIVALVMVMRRRLFARNVDPVELQYGKLMVVIFLLGTVATFLTWTVFWFMLGFLCKRPSPRIQEAYG